MNDMYFDPSDFDFTSLTDIVVKDDKPALKAAPAPTRDMNEYGGAVDDISDLTGFSPLPQDEPEQEEDFNADVSDLEYEPEEETNEVTDYFNQAPDDAVLTVGERSATKAELAELLAKKDEIEESHQALTYQAHEFNAGTRYITDKLSKLMTGAERQIKHIDEALRGNVDNDTYRRLMDRRYAEKAELQQLQMMAKEAGEIRTQQEMLAVNNFVATSDQQMLRENPNWYQTKQQLLGWLIENGALSNDPAVQHEFAKTYSIPNIKIWLKAYKADQTLKAIKEKATKPKLARSTPSAVNTNRENPNVNLQAKKAIQSMGSNRQANVNAFAFLKD